MPVTFDANKMKLKFLEYVKDCVDDDISARADRVLAVAKTDNFGFTDRTHKLRDSIHKVKGRHSRISSYSIVADAKDPFGNSYAYWVEMGHPGKVSKKTELTEDGEPIEVESRSGGSAPHPYLGPALAAARNSDG